MSERLELRHTFVTPGNTVRLPADRVGRESFFHVAERPEGVGLDLWWLEVVDGAS